MSGVADVARPAAAASVALSATPAEGQAPSAGAPLLPAPAAYDDVAALYGLLVQSNDVQTATSKQTITAEQAEQKKAQDDENAALAAARAAESKKKGFFDSMGIGSLVGFAVGSPIAVMADMSMHMAGVTPDFVKNFEDKNQAAIAVAAKVYAGAGDAAMALGGERSLAAASALGGLIVEKTQVLGKDASDYVGTALSAGAGLMTGNVNGAAIAVVSDKQSATADQIRKVERETQDYTKWAAVAGMALAGAGAIAATAGTATGVVVAIGVALSASGFLTTETGCLDKVVGHDAATWIGTGMMVAGAVVSGFGAVSAGADASQAAQSLEAAGQGVSGAADYLTGNEQLAAAVVAHEADEDQADATAAQQRGDRAMSRLQDTLAVLQALPNELSRGFQAASSIVDTRGQTELAIASMKG